MFGICNKCMIVVIRCDMEEKKDEVDSIYNEGEVCVVVVYVKLFMEVGV